MRLTIDSELAASSTVGAGFRSPRAAGGAVFVEMGVERQLFRNWCWAAIAASLGRYYGTTQASQAEIARRVMAAEGADDAGDEESGSEDGKEFRLDRALTAAGCFGHWSAGKPVFDRVRFEINLGRPFCPRIGWHQGGAHYVVIHGYREKGERVLVADSLHGPAEHALREFPGRYREGGAWTETFWTTPAGTTKAEGLSQ